MVRIRLIFLLSIAYSSIQGQEFVVDSTRALVHSLETEVGILISAKDRLPFWMSSNNSGRFKDEDANSIYQTFAYDGTYQLAKKLSFGWDLESFLLTRETIKGKFVQANLRIETDFWKLRGGYEEEFFGLNDSTLSIGNLVYSNNARPIPKISISTNGWQKSPILGQFLSFQAYLAHGQFEENRIQSKALLHQKYFYLRGKGFQNKLSIIFGLNHNAQWGGSNSQNESSQPTGIRNYMRILMGSSGGNDALLTDQQNALGNHLGSYDLSGSFEFENFVLTNYWQFLWEDKSGLTPFNWRDGLMGSSVKFKNGKLIKKVLLEIVRTNDQNAQKVADDGTPIFEPDSFFNNGVYKTGWSFHNQVIGNPMFLILNEESISSSRIKNTINAVNVGVSGQMKDFNYQVNYTEFRNKGTKLENISPSLKLRAIIFLIEYKMTQNSRIGSRINYQESNFQSQRNFGLQVSYRHLLNF